jgi:hypothetical protein
MNPTLSTKRFDNYVEDGSSMRIHESPSFWIERSKKCCRNYCILFCDIMLKVGDPNPTRNFDVKCITWRAETRRNTTRENRKMCSEFIDGNRGIEVRESSRPPARNLPRLRSYEEGLSCNEYHRRELLKKMYFIFLISSITCDCVKNSYSNDNAACVLKCPNSAPLWTGSRPMLSRRGRSLSFPHAR